MRISVILGVLLLAFSYGGCTTVGEPTGERDAQERAEEPATDKTDSEEGTTVADGSGGPVLPEDQRLLQVTEDYWIQTPWFGVSSIILVVKRLPGPSAIIVPAHSILAGTMSSVPAAVEKLPADHRRSRVKVGVSFHLGSVPPFVEPDRYNPDRYNNEEYF